jgi:carboxymethylenebutenolidase
MKTPTLLITFFTLLAASIGYTQETQTTQDTAVTTFKVTSQPVRYQSGPDTVRGVLYVPDAKGKLPGVVVIHEWYGLNDWVKESAQKIAERGYVTLAIDLYRGKVATDGDQAHQLMRGVPEDRATRDLQTAVEFLRAQKNVDRARVGSIGWCMGGGYSLQTALSVPDLAACVIAYGRLVTENETISLIGCPVLGIFGADDQGIPAESVTQFEKQARGLGKNVNVHIYDKAGHAFMNQNNDKGYNADATKDAWNKVFAFFDSTLKPPKANK